MKIYKFNNLFHTNKYNNFPFLNAYGDYIWHLKLSRIQGITVVNLFYFYTVEPHYNEVLGTMKITLL